MYIVIEKFDRNNPVIVTDSGGDVWIFDDEEDAKTEAYFCQDGQVVELT